MSAEAGFALSEQDGAVRVALDGELALKDVQQIHKGLCDALARGRPLTIDVSDLRGADISIVQLLIAARKSAEQSGAPITIDIETSPALKAVLAGVGVIGADGTARGDDEEFWFGGNGDKGNAA